MVAFTGEASVSSTLRARTSAAALVVAVALTSGAAAHAAESGTTIRVSVATDGSPGEYNDARQPAISADGRYVAFSTADPLADNDTDFSEDVYLHDTATGVTELVSVGPDGKSPAGGSLPAVSADGRFVVFVSDAELTPDAGWSGATYLRDRSTGTTTRVGPKMYWWSGRPDLSADGRFVVLATNVNAVPQDTNIDDDVYLWDRTTGALTVVSAGSDGKTASGDSDEPAVSDDGRYVTYRTASKAVHGGVEGSRVVVTDRTTRRSAVVSATTGSTPAISGDGRWIAYTVNRSTYQTDVLLWQRASGATTTISMNVAGKPAKGTSLRPRLNADGRYVAFWSTAHDLVPDTLTAPLSLFRWDRTSGRNVVVMTPPDGAFHVMEEADISADGRFVAFETQSGALVEGDTNGKFDVFRADVAITPAALQVTKAPAVTGTAKVGATVKAAPGDWTFVPASYAYQWAADGTPITGATGASYAVTAKELGKRLTVTVTARRDGYLPGTAGSAASSPVAQGAAPKVTTKPKITGTARVGRTVRANVGAWAPKAGSYRYEWRLNGTLIRGATATSLRLTASMRNKRVTLTVIARKAGHSDGRAASAAVTVGR